MLLGAFRPLLAGIREVVLQGYPAHRNAGDALIWLGQLRLLATLGIKVRHVGEGGALDPRMMRDLPPDVAVLLTGGGSFGDLWVDIQSCRELDIVAAAGRRVIQFPQSLCFRDEANITLARRVLHDHGDVVLTWRDDHSYKLALEMFPEVTSVLVPDVAFALGPLHARGHRAVKILCISRTDHEGGELAALRLPDGKQTDWPWNSTGPLVLRRAPVWAMLGLERRVGQFLADPLRTAVCNGAARVTVDTAKGLVSGADVVVSDRLHAHVLCSLLGIPHVVVDTRFGKISSFIDTWMGDCELVNVAESPHEAIEMARAIAKYRARRRDSW
jgi:pyruvyl transferase EpsO